MGSAFVVAVAVGIGVAGQVAILGRRSGELHPLAISVSLQFAGLLVGTVWAVSQRAWSDVTTVFVQWWWIPVGALGWLLVAALGFASHRIGVAPTPQHGRPTGRGSSSSGIHLTFLLVLRPTCGSLTARAASPSAVRQA